MGEEQQASQVAGEASSLRAVAWQRFWHGPGDDLGRRLYEPALSRAVRYDRCCAYFSSTVLAAAAVFRYFRLSTRLRLHPWQNRYRYG